MAKQVDIVIVGAGMAGLSAALECQRNQCSFVVLEARDRPGGRIQTIRTKDGQVLDLGAQWVGANQSRLQALIDTYGLHTTPTYTRGKTIYEIKGKLREGGRLPPLSPLGALDLFLLKRKINQRIKRLPQYPWIHSPHAYEFDQQTIDQFIENNMFSQDAKAFYKMVIEDRMCCSMSEVSLLDLLFLVQSTGTDNYLMEAETEWIVEGAQSLAERMAQSLGSAILYSSPVLRISYGGRVTSVYTENQCWKTQKVILAVPPNLTTRIQFHPPLPALRAQLSERSGMPSVIKMAVLYPGPFWRSKGWNGRMYSNQEPIMSTMDISPPNESTGILAVFITGKQAREMGRMTVGEREQKVIQSLTKFFGPQASQPQAFYEKIWSEEEWTKGGYATHYAPGVLTQFGHALFEPVSNRLHWAGTEAAMEWRTYMEGAVQSGQQIATEVIRSLHS
ncbi:FAD-dependent oxidoreductase [Ammoniphilus sp. YIM 78166]|uniref:flavin monoamine oxidase family protein n=1 Tax=Ammoniphilus sp. YIM 78166 TaxID=1644106 RepID=UPI00106F9CCA|nr:FAD-dependent oxidoreductase [Ammoniphilus sp. YIM 78166]